jgi:hypothetical protein
MTRSPFDQGPDAELGRLLREELTGPAPEAFLRRLRMAVAGAERGDQWDVLAGWARPRAMAMAIAAGLLLWIGTWFFAAVPAAEPGVTMASLPAHTVMSAQAPAAADIMAALRGVRR